MEVHHHSHTSRKKWTHYFWEFLMLFLAVFCGFLAENQREHMVEHRRAKQYASSLYRELQSDTAKLHHLILWTQHVANRLDTLCELSRKQPRIKNGKLYYYSRTVAWVDYFTSSTSTLSQLKNSGSLRILSPGIAQKISNYDRLLVYSANTDNFQRIEYETINSLRLKIFDGRILAEMDNPTDSVFNLDPPLLNNDPKLIGEFFGWVKTNAGYLRTAVREIMEPMKESAEELLLLLKNEYHLSEGTP